MQQRQPLYAHMECSAVNDRLPSGVKRRSTLCSLRSCEPKGCLYVVE
ncbi:unnamed protein product [Chondrus crispus]|uniref:Uncharacterized protein n=1 Tax=Chondrus crispus TaxID=2769 RepID=R7QNB0_CHOCR|nr:unnamed protein product [Chondrus crispus]CDF39579.1 unnamed protein product [Chondrus crispus]|eukprot:XP_005709873.1 unnamed protein product [Chondrus crispus]